VTLYRAFLDRLRAFRVLDPACGSGNFLNLALLALKDMEHRVGIEAEAMGLHREFPQIGPTSVHGIEINPYAAELARVSVWIGEIQWMRRNGFDVSRNPILKPLDTIDCRDAILNPDGTEAAWPDARSTVVSPSSRRPSSRSTCATQLRIACADGSNSFASCSGVGRGQWRASPARQRCSATAISRRRREPTRRAELT
jgi:hypothetical protein